MASTDSERASSDSESARSGRKPQTFGQCLDCQTVYLVHVTEDGEYHPVGTDGTCNCGSDEFVTSSDE